MKHDLPPGVFRRFAGRHYKSAGTQGSYCKVTADGTRRIWTKLCNAKEGLLAMYAALAQLMAQDLVDDRMPKLIADWQREEMVTHAEKTQKDERRMCRHLADALIEFRVDQVEPPNVTEVLKPFKRKPRTHNRYRSLLRELMRFAMEKGLRKDNPVDPIKTVTEPARTRYITDSELRRIKVAGMYGDDGKRTRSGAMLCCLIDMAYLTGQRIGDLLALKWDALGRNGIEFEPSKVKGKTGVRVLIEWTPRLRDVERRLKLLRKECRERLLKRGTRTDVPQVFTTQTGAKYTYWGASTAWKRAVRRSGVKGVHFHDLRAKALTDLEGAEGMRAAKAMGGHSTEAQTADYVRHKTARKTKATK